ncbi:MAG: DMT family transporter [Spirochaetes bacterium]|nr:DMT family transporter [Spirochaetota bacterium]MBU0955929.1 DMT family transporter [Spirochaetota bacterium]
MDRIGEIAAFGTAICWTLSAIFFERATRRISVLAVNLFKLLFAMAFLTLSAWIVRGLPFPTDASGRAWLFLSLSGLIGFVITDIFLFTAYKTIGSRMSTLFLALSPPVTALLGFLFLGEAMGPRALLGMLLVVAGIIIAVLARGKLQIAGRKVQVPVPSHPGDQHPASRPVLMSKEDKRGYLFAFLSTIGQSIGMILTKHGLQDYHPIAGSNIRIMAGIVGFLVVGFFWDRGKSYRSALKDRAGLKFTFFGAIAGPFLGVTLSLFAMQKTMAGVVSTLIGLTPILIIPPSILLFKQKVKAAEIGGALLAVAGTAVFFL